MVPRNWDKRCRVELIGFVNSMPDSGVEDFLSRMEKKPRYVVLQARCNEMHRRCSSNKSVLYAAFRSYDRQPCDQGKRRQNCTASQLRGLLAEIRKHGIGMILEASSSITTSKGIQGRRLTEYDEGWNAAC